MSSKKKLDSCFESGALEDVIMTDRFPGPPNTSVQAHSTVHKLIVFWPSLGSLCVFRFALGCGESTVDHNGH